MFAYRPCQLRCVLPTCKRALLLPSPWFWSRPAPHKTKQTSERWDRVLPRASAPLRDMIPALLRLTALWRPGSRQELIASIFLCLRPPLQGRCGRAVRLPLPAALPPPAADLLGPRPCCRPAVVQPPQGALLGTHRVCRWHGWSRGGAPCRSLTRASMVRSAGHLSRQELLGVLARLPTACGFIQCTRARAKKVDLSPACRLEAGQRLCVAAAGGEGEGGYARVAILTTQPRFTPLLAYFHLSTAPKPHPTPPPPPPHTHSAGNRPARAAAAAGPGDD